MNRTTLLAFATGSLATTAIAILIAAGPEHKENTNTKNLDHAKGTMDDPENYMKEMIRISTPNEHHKELGKAVGDWNAKTSFFMDPSQPPMEGEGTMTVEWVLGERYTKGHFKSDFMGQAFEGIAYTGYDIAHQQYVTTWMDTMSTKILNMAGTLNDQGSVELLGTATTPMGDNPTKLITTWIDDDTFKDEFFDQLEDGSWFMSGTITYTRN